MRNWMVGSGETDPQLILRQSLALFRFSMLVTVAIVLFMVWSRAQKPFARIGSQIKIFGITVSGELEKRSVEPHAVPETFSRENASHLIAWNIRDPFSPAQLDSGRKKRKRKKYLLRGLAMVNGRKYAMIGGQTVSIGDWIYGMRVINIRNNRVVLANNRRIRILSLF